MMNSTRSTWRKLSILLFSLAGLLYLLSLLSFARQKDPNFDPTSLNRQYSTWAKIVKQIKDYEKAYPKLIYQTSIGKTVQGKDIIAVRLSSDAAVDTGNPEVCFQSGTHGNETGGMMATMRLLRDLVEEYGKDPRITKMMDTRQVWVIPVLNLDAKVYRDEPQKERNPKISTRKNLRATPNGYIGVDLNRNFGIRWACSPSDESSKDYRGTDPLSEPESQALDRFFTDHPLRVYVDFHANMGMFFLTYDLPPGDAERYERLVQEMLKRQKTPYRRTQINPITDIPRGRSLDKGLTNLWAYYAHGIYGINLEVHVDSQKTASLDARRRYENNIQEPLFFLIEEAVNLPLPTQGNARLMSHKADNPLKPGTTIVWTPTIEGKCDYAQLVSRGGAIQPMGDRRLIPLKMPFAIEIDKNAKPGMHVPMELYMWTFDRQRSVAKFELIIE